MSDPVIYNRNGTLFVLQDEKMRDYFAECEGGLPEAPLIDWAWETFHPSVFVDIGSHVGTWAHTFATAGRQTRKYGDAIVYAWEPNQELQRYWNASKYLNNTQSLLHSTALSDGYGVAHLAGFFQDGGGATLLPFPKGTTLRGVTEDVLTATLDSQWIRPSFWPKRIELIKIDVEGLELPVLRGGLRTIKTDKPAIIFECWEDERGQTIDGLFRFLHTELEYRTYRVSWPETWVAEPTSLT